MTATNSDLTLFVGGPFHGETLMTDPDKTFAIMLAPAPAVIDWSGETLSTLYVEREAHRYEIIRSGGHKFAVIDTHTAYEVRQVRRYTEAQVTVSRRANLPEGDAEGRLTRSVKDEGADPITVWFSTERDSTGQFLTAAAGGLKLVPRA